MVLSTWTLMVQLGISSNNNTSHSSSLLLLSTNMHLSDPPLFWLLRLRPRLSKVERKTSVPEHQSNLDSLPNPSNKSWTTPPSCLSGSKVLHVSPRTSNTQAPQCEASPIATRALNPVLFKKALSRLHRSNHLFYLNKICLFAQKNCVCTHAQLGLSIGLSFFVAQG